MGGEEKKNSYEMFSEACNEMIGFCLVLCTLLVVATALRWLFNL